MLRFKAGKRLFVSFHIGCQQMKAEIGSLMYAEVFEEVKAMWVQLQAMDPKSEILELTGQANFFQSKEAQAIFIRKSYRGIYKRIAELYDDYTKGQQRYLKGKVIVTGNPGIGKSYFLFYLLLEFCLKGKIVVLQLGKQGLICLFQPGKAPQVVSGNKPNFPELSSKETIFLYDPEPGVEPKFVHAFTIISSSPNKKNFKEFRKEPSEKLYMPTWTWDELQECNKILWSMPVDDLKKGFAYFGGVPRYIRGNQEYLGDLHAAVEQADYLDIMKHMGNLETAPEASHKLLQYVVTENFCVKHVTFASKYVSDLLLQRWLKLRSFRVHKLYLQTADSPALRAFAGALWQHACSQILPKVRVKRSAHC
jgi:hypothetical protein